MSYALLVQVCMSAFVVVKAAFGPFVFCGSYARLAINNGYCEYFEHAHQFVSVNMAVSSCQVFFVLVPCVRYCYNY